MSNEYSMKSIKNIFKQNNIDSEYSRILSENEHIFKEIYQACNSSFIPGDGSYLFEGSIYEYSLNMYQKQNLLFNTAKTSYSVIEIGVYMGHSLLIMLLGNPKLKVTAIDIVDTYARPSIEVLKKYFPESEISFFHEDSLNVLPNIKQEKYDLFHIDGHHLEEHIKKEVIFCEKLSSHIVNNERAIRIIFDDVHCCSGLIKDIIKNKKVLHYIKPECIWANSYIEYFI